MSDPGNIPIHELWRTSSAKAAASYAYPAWYSGLLRATPEDVRRWPLLTEPITLEAVVSGSMRLQ